MAKAAWRWAAAGALCVGLIGAGCRENRSETTATPEQAKQEQTWNPGGAQGTGSFDSTRGDKAVGNDGTQTQGWGQREGTGGSGTAGDPQQQNQTWNPGGEDGTGSFDSTANTPTLPGPVRDEAQPDHHNQTR